MDRGFEAVALADFEAQDAAELSFKAGDWLTVLPTAAPDGWRIGRRGKREGLVPRTYVQEVEALSLAAGSVGTTAAAAAAAAEIPLEMMATPQMVTGVLLAGAAWKTADEGRRDRA
eukprot:1522825-Pleurochrysis_carterae.AAC.1